MSLYNMIHGFNPLAGILLVGLKLRPEAIDRFRDAALYNKDRDENDFLIRVLTRTGGPNRESHQDSINRLMQHECFLKEEDDAFDSTYMYFFFKVPEDFKEVFSKHPDWIRASVDNKTIKEKADRILQQQ